MKLRDDQKKSRSKAVTVESFDQSVLKTLQDKATRLRIDSVRSTTEAGSGHPTSCASAAEIMAVLFYSVMRYDPRDPHNRESDIFVLSKGHAAPILYAAWAEAGAFPREKLLTLRKIDSDLEGHPTPRLPFVDVATGSLGQGLSVGVGMALDTKQLENSDQRVFVLLGDGESAEGSVWKLRSGRLFTGSTISVRLSTSIDSARASRQCFNTNWKSTRLVGKHSAGRR
jgi:transketolase